MIFLFGDNLFFEHYLRVYFVMWHVLTMQLYTYDPRCSRQRSILFNMYDSKLSE